MSSAGTSFVFVVLGLCAELSLAQSPVVSLRVGEFKHITFDELTPTQYRNDGDTLVLTVKSSASFLVLPFDKVRTVKKVTFEWQGDAVAAVKDAAHEASKDGDDAPLRLGLIMSGEPPIVPFFAPAWIKSVRGTLKLPSDKLLYLIPQARHKPGEKWTSPYSDSIECVALADTAATKDGWRKSRLELPTALPIVGLWIMADGDNTQSSFTSRLRNLRFE